MFKTKKPDCNHPGLSAEIAKLISELEGLDSNSKEYSTIVKRILQLDSIMQRNPQRAAISWDAIISAGASLSGILLILKFEKFGAITTKALSFVMKTRV